MRQLIAVSSALEILPFIEQTSKLKLKGGPENISLNDRLSLSITGVGSPSTIFHLTSFLAKNSFDRLIQVGIAGSYNKSIGLGSLVEVGEDRFADLGIDDRGTFLSLSDAGLADSDEFPFAGGKLLNPDKGISGLRIASSITVNTASGSQEIIKERKEKFNPDIESMEGAAAFYVGLGMGLAVMQVRSISNYVEPRDRRKWEMKAAVENLNNWLIKFVNMQ